MAASGSDLDAVFGLTVGPVDARVQRWIDAMPQYGPDHADAVAEVRAASVSDVFGVLGAARRAR
jgi:protoporphyrinogen oxidase